MRLFLFLNTILFFNGFSFSQGEYLEVNKGWLNVYLEPTPQPSFQFEISSFAFKMYRSRIREKRGSYRVKRLKNSKEFPVKVLSVLSNKVELSVNGISVWITLNDGTLDFLCERFEDQSIEFELSTDPAEHFYGGGVQFSHSCFDGKTYENICEKNGQEREYRPASRWAKLVGLAGNEQATSFPLSRFVSNYHRGFMVDSYASHHLSFEAEKSIRFELIPNTAKLLLFKGNTPISVVRNYPKKTVSELAFPDWAFGTILGVQGGTEAVLKKVKMVKGAGAKIEAVWLPDWSEKKESRSEKHLNWKWQLDQTNYPEFESFKTTLKKDHIQLLGYINPFFSEKGTYTTEGLKKGYFVKNQAGDARLFDDEGINGYMLDVFNEKAYNWMKIIIEKELIGNGFSGWMADFGEWYPVTEEHDIERHNMYVARWQAMHYEILNAYEANHPNQSPLFVFHRSGADAKGLRGQSIWAGDQFTNYGLHDRLPSVIKAYQSTGISGLGLMHSDVGGYTGIRSTIIRNSIRSETVLADWMRLEAFTPIFKTHEGRLSKSHVHVYSTTKMAQQFAHWSKVNHALRPYFKELMRLNQKEKIPYYIHPVLFDLPKGKGKNDLRLFIGTDLCIDYVHQPKKTPPTLPLEQFVQMRDDLTFSSEIKLKKRQHIVLYVRKESKAHQLLKDLAK